MARKDCEQPCDQLCEADRCALDLSEVRADIKDLINDPCADYGSNAAILIRFSWHCCGTYDCRSGTGGSNGGTMRFPQEQRDPENVGMYRALALLEPIRCKYPWLSFADLSVLVGTVALEATGGPCIRFCTGREDYCQEKAAGVYGTCGCPFGDGRWNPNGSRLPPADLGPDDSCVLSGCAHREAATIHAVRMTFRRMGFCDKETVCLIVLGHQYGRAHREFSGYDGPWYGFDPTHWNIYRFGLGYLATYNLLLSWYKPVITCEGKRQFEASILGQKWMMLVSDMTLVWDPDFRKHLHFYNHDRAAFFRDSAKCWKKLTELGCEGLLVEERTSAHWSKVPRGATLSFCVSQMLKEVPGRVVFHLASLTPCLCFLFLFFVPIIVLACTAIYSSGDDDLA